MSSTPSVQISSFRGLWLRDLTAGRVLPSKRSNITALYVTVVRILQTIRFYHVRNERYASMVRSLIGSSLQEGCLIVDMGCGPGGLTALLRGNHRLLGLDKDREALIHFTEPRVPRIQALAERLPFLPKSIDVVLAISLVEHIEEQSAFFVEIARVMRPGGYLVLQLPELRYPIEPHTKWPLLHLWNPAVQARILAATGYEDLNMSTSLPRIQGLAAAAGFQVDRIIALWHFRLARVFRAPMGYFISFRATGG